jgi:probable FeS assembly SUF system protein SufT
MENDRTPIALTRDVEAVQIPAGTRVTLPAGTLVVLNQVLGGSYTVGYDYGMARIDGKDADALGKTVTETKVTTSSPAGKPATREEIEKQAWAQMKTCYDPEIPVNIVDLGLVYDCAVKPEAEGSYKVDVKMTLTAPGCGMGPVLTQDVQNRLLCIEGVDDVNVELVWDPQWNQGMMTEAAKLQLGLM